jgi:hypothetical protein
MDKFIFPFFHGNFGLKSGGAGISMGYPYFTFFISHFSVKKEPYRNFFSLLLVDKERPSYVD